MMLTLRGINMTQGDNEVGAEKKGCQPQAPLVTGYPMGSTHGDG